jgi:hypothetical protein
MAAVSSRRGERVDDREVLLHRRNDAVGQEWAGVLDDGDAVAVDPVEVGGERVVEAGCQRSCSVRSVAMARAGRSGVISRGPPRSSLAWRRTEVAERQVCAGA